MSARPAVRTIVSRLALALVAALSLVCLPHAAASAAPSASNGVVTLDVVSFGARGDGVSDNTTAFAAAIAAAESRRGAVIQVPAGTFAFTKRIPRTAATSIATGGAYPISIEGAGRSKTKLVEHVKEQTLLGVRTDGAIISGLTLDTQTFGGGIALNVQADRTLVIGDTVLGQNSTVVPGAGVTGKFAIYYQGHPGGSSSAPPMSSGNRVQDLIVEDGIQNDGFSFSFQRDATISDVIHFGSRLALYKDSNVIVSGYTYSPNPRCGSSANGYFITPPSDHILIDGFNSAGAGGVIGGAGQSAVSTDIAISNETLSLGTSEHLTVGNVSTLAISGLRLGPTDTVVIDSPNIAHKIMVENSRIPQVEFTEWGGHRYSEADVHMQNVDFPAYAPGGVPGATFWHLPAAGPATVELHGGRWNNLAGGLFRGTGITINGSL